MSDPLPTYQVGDIVGWMNGTAHARFLVIKVEGENIDTLDQDLLPNEFIIEAFHLDPIAEFIDRLTDTEMMLLHLGNIELLGQHLNTRANFSDCNLPYHKENFLA